jgi:L-amino acid N-acyltransferase YncA
MSVTLRAAVRDDAAAVAALYNYFVLNTVITFEESAVPVEEMSARIGAVAARGLPWLVLEGAQGLLGYACASPWKVRQAYRFAVETTIYLQPGAGGRGYGTSLYTALLRELRGHQLHTAIGGVALPNEASVRLHERLGFQRVAYFKEVGFKQQRWIDVAYWQLLLQP